MKIRFLKEIFVEVYKPKLDETWDISIHKWQELRIEEIYGIGSHVDILTSDGDTIANVPMDSFEVLK